LAWTLGGKWSSFDCELRSVKCVKATNMGIITV
jgi:hypothetical protein